MGFNEILEAGSGSFDQRKDLPVVLIDSDTICFRASAATDGRMYVVGMTAFKYKADAVEYCTKNGLPVSDIDIDFYPEPISHAIHIVRGAIKDIKQVADKLFSPGGYTMEFFHTGRNNFRHGILDGYKESRVGTRRPEHLAPLRKYISKKFSERTVDGLEADDLIGIRVYECIAEGRDYLVVTNDKDLKTLPGDGYNWVKKELYSMDDVECMKFFYSQCIAGDDADDIPGVDGLGINDKGTGKATKIIEKACKNFDYKEGNLEVVLYETALNSWLDGPPGKAGSFGCQPLSEIEESFAKSAKCLFILHKNDKLWEVPTEESGNYDKD